MLQRCRKAIRTPLLYMQNRECGVAAERAGSRGRGDGKREFIRLDGKSWSVPYYPITANLLADALGADTAALATAPQALLDYAQTLITGEELMFTMDVPYAPAYDTPIVLAQAAVDSATPTAILNECQEIDHQKGPTSAFHVVDPAYMIKNYFQPTYNIDLSNIKVTLLQGTQHGNLFSEIDNLGFTSYHYDPAPGYLGDDQAKFMTELELGGKHIRIVIIVQIKVLESVDEKSPTCPDPVMIKAPKPTIGDSGYSTGYNLAAVSVTFADLAGGALGTIGDRPRFLLV